MELFTAPYESDGVAHVPCDARHLTELYMLLRLIATIYQRKKGENQCTRKFPPRISRKYYVLKAETCTEINSNTNLYTTCNLMHTSFIYNYIQYGFPDPHRTHTNMQAQHAPHKHAYKIMKLHNISNKREGL